MNDLDKNIKTKMEENLDCGSGPKIIRFALSALGGLVPFVGGAIGGASSAWGEAEQEKINNMYKAWLKMQEEEINEIGLTLSEVMVRLDQNDENIQKRLQSPEYLKLVKKCFRDWSAAESEEKRKLIRNLLSNAASSTICTDDQVRLFIEWIDKYSEAHFKVIREVFNNPGITRYEIWQNIHGEKVREDSAEADLFKTILFDLNVGHIIRQEKDTDGNGNFVKVNRPRRKTSTTYYKSVFDNVEPYVLTGLGSWFVSYTMNEIVPRIASPDIQAETNINTN